METIYALWEAHRLAKAEATVGQAYTIEVFRANGTPLTLSDAGTERCESLYRKFGPKLDLTKKQQALMDDLRPEFLEPSGEQESAAAPA